MPQPTSCASSAAISIAARSIARRNAAGRCRRPSNPMSLRLDHAEEALSEIHEINVTPFIDVILVLLIIFMIAAPLATVDISVDLPAANAEPSRRPDKPLYLTLKADLTLAIDNDSVNRGALAAALDQAT